MAFDYNSASPEEIRAEAERRQRARTSWNTGEDLTPAMQRRKDMLLEKEVQSKVLKLYARYGCRVFNTSQPRHAKFMSKGIPDLLIFSPKHVPTQATGFAARWMWYHETKRPKDGRYSDEQLAFAQLCREAGVTIVGGGVEEAQLQLDRLGLDPR